MEKPSLLTAVNKLAILGECAGFSVEQMIRLLNAGLSMETLLQLIDSRLDDATKESVAELKCSRWIM